MEKKPLHFLKYFLICSVCFSVSAMAMQRDANECNSSLSIKKSVKGYPIPPVITYEDYVTSLCFEDGEIEGWGEPTGQIAAWIGKPENKKYLVDLDGTFLNDLPFFQITLNPVIDNNRLRCDYTLPAPKTDLYQGKTPILSLYYNANLEEMSAVRKSMRENNFEFWERLAKWKSILKTKQQVTNARTLRLLHPLAFIPLKRQVTGSFSLAADHEIVRYAGIFSYLNFDGATMQARTSIGLLTYPSGILFNDPDIANYQSLTGQLFINYRPDTEFYSDKYDREPLIHGLPVRRETTYFQHNYPLNLTALGYSSFVKCFFDINGPLTINTSKLHLKAVHFWVVGDLLFKPIEETCLIEEIRITACNSSQPIKLDGTLDFSQDPKIDLEGLNAARINIKCRDLAKTLPVPPSSTLDQIIYTIKKIDPQQETSLRLTKTGDCQSIKFGSLTAVTNHNAAANYQLESDRFSVEEDDIIKASYKITVHPGGKMSLGWLNTARNGWYGSSELILEEGSHEGIYKRRVPIGETEASLVFRNYHLEIPGQTTFTIEKIEIQQEPLLKLIFTHHPIQIAKEQDGATTVVTDHNAAANYQLTSVRFSVKEDSIIKVPYKITVQPAGRMSMGLLNTASNGWYGSELILGAGTHEGIYKRRVLAGETEASLVFRNYHLETPGKTTFRIEELKIQQEPLLKLNPTNNPTQVVKEQDGATTVITDYSATASYQLESDRFSVKEDSIINVPYKITVQPDGQMSMGLLNTARNGWYGSELILGEGTHEGIYERQVPKGETVASLVFRNYHLETPNQTTFTIERIEIQKGKM